MGVLCTLKILGKFKFFSEIMGVKLFGGVAHWGVPYIRTVYITFCTVLWALKNDVEILANSTSGLEL